MIDLIGQKFNRLFIIKRMDNSKWGHYRWLCLCDCGKEKTILGKSLKNGDTKSCGCLQIEKATKHGHRKNKKESKIYKAWKSMIQRCNNPSHEYYCHYGGRGIKVCKRWRYSFENFLKDMGKPPTEKHTLDRIDNDGNYCKKNCRWATRKQQSRNTRRNHMITYDGKTQCLSEWAEEYQIPYDTLSTRINKLNWSIKKALTTPIRKRRK